MIEKSKKEKEARSNNMTGDIDSKEFQIEYYKCEVQKLEA